MPYGSVYTLKHDSISVSTGITIMQIKAGTGGGLTILRAWCDQSSSTTSATQRIQFVRKSAAATVTAAVLGTTLLDVYATGVTASAVLSTTGTGITATGEGTDGDVVYPDAFNILNGWLYVPVPEERIFVPASGIIGLKFAAAPAAATTWQAGITFQELG